MFQRATPYNEPIVEHCFPTYASKVEYWEMGDLPLASPREAVARMIDAVHECIGAL